jgi:hypothetical protein
MTCRYHSCRRGRRALSSEASLAIGPVIRLQTLQDLGGLSPRKFINHLTVVIASASQIQSIDQQTTSTTYESARWLKNKTTVKLRALHCMSWLICFRCRVPFEPV